MSALADLLAEAPASIKRLPLNPRGYPVPWFVDRKAPQRDGGPDFRVMDRDRLKLAIRERRCWVCGGRITGPEATFVAGPMCGINRTSAEPPSHLDCARWSVQACPFLSQPKRIRDDRDLPGGLSQAGIGIRRNPGVTLLWTTDQWKTWRPQAGGLLFEMGAPKAVEWWREGRAAKRAEVLESVATGLPLLLAEAAKEGPEASFELGRYTERFMVLVVGVPE
jgi:hypothetical protein